jgi:hypothetical protein
MRLVWYGLAAPLVLHAQFEVHLNAATEKAFEEYQKAAEARMDWSARFTATKPGEFTIVPFNKEGAIEVKGGAVHDWAAGTIAPATTVEKVLSVLQNYAEYKTIYAPEVADSKLLAHEGNHWRAYLRLIKKKVLTAVLNSEYDVEYRPLGVNRWSVISHSTKISEVEGDRELPPASGRGFLWRLNAYWLIEPRPGGVYIECRTISLTRDIPAGLGWAIRPFVSSVPRESLRATLEATVRAAQRLE